MTVYCAFGIMEFFCKKLCHFYWSYTEFETGSYETSSYDFRVRKLIDPQLKHTVIPRLLEALISLLSLTQADWKNWFLLLTEMEILAFVPPLRMLFLWKIKISCFWLFSALSHIHSNILKIFWLREMCIDHLDWMLSRRNFSIVRGFDSVRISMLPFFWFPCQYRDFDIDLMLV